MLLTKYLSNTEAREYAVSKKDELTDAVVKQFQSAQPRQTSLVVWDPAKTMLLDAVSGKRLKLLLTMR